MAAIIRRTKYTEDSPVEPLLLRERMGLTRYRKNRERDPEKRRILMELALKKMAEAEKADYIHMGSHRRRLKG